MKKNLYDICLNTVRIAKLYFGVKYRDYSCREKISKCSRTDNTYGGRNDEVYAEKFSQKHTDLCVRFFLCVHIGWDYRMGILSGKKFFPKGMAELQSSEKISLY